MGSMSLWHWVIVALVVLLLFGKGRISDMMGDLAKGIKSFKKGLAEDDISGTTTPQAPPAQVTQNPAAQATSPEQTPR
ncbi:twin-arginine translocase TatA/TatE family subunit [Sandaracinobacteroides hominis]|uniref:twin-arginine translocase TatA/TatE family subunit n=1 Tax=Sandaracinobacteroides hominis TaxID=2780086 RepID=UPI0018F385E5|nr:twin-arginine translocase TatA/TatE family subunit [Sandaracinobacteroides hominis]